MPEPIRVTTPLVQEPTGPDAPAEQQQEQLLAGKFKNAQELEKGYVELEKKLGSREQTPVTPKPTDSISKPAVEAPAELDITPFQDEWDKNGKLSDESYQKLAKDHRVTKGQVDEFIQSRLAKVQQFHNEVYDSVGGAETFGQMIEWAKAELSPADQNAYDKATASGDPDIIKMAVQSLHGKFVSAYGKSPNLIGGRAGAAGPAPFRSQAEMIEAMSDRRYDQDEAYRADVEKRVINSKFF